MQETTQALAFEVRGLPPQKTETLSILSAGHRQAERVRALLLAALAAAQQSGWTPTRTEVSLEIVVRGSASHVGSAPRFLAGVADVLSDKRGRLTGTHLGVLADVTLYADERQIRAITYREEPADEPSYLVRVTALGV
ncbi:hypothetical protein Ais01nite_57380 [Asanoa ishikariensis]|uniref:Uncharacterized protein n=1 Tax=Asanoa ishikariensis TaxID=137265 RepID=A0A1H3TYE2_9ACTN|nr:hypothetical protein [Asanoa ishikariensis]GIF67703.1 hypothetical protein Ais01nite_57380 [Asanoa ishikariensis]SDZ55246.1 hypothetical protein SAMN05421684_6600 [Asanoa ishikariensis]